MYLRFTDTTPRRLTLALLTLVTLAGPLASAQIVAPGKPIDAPILGRRCPCANPGPELVDNGSFENQNANDCPLGHSGFGGQVGRCAVIDSATPKNGQWTGFPHTGGWFLGVDPPSSVGTVTVWSQKVTLGPPAASHRFSAYAMNLWPTGKVVPEVRLAIYQGNNPVAISAWRTLPAATAGRYHRLELCWRPESAGTYELRIEVQNPQGIGSDLGIDDVSFTACCGPDSAIFSLPIDRCSGLPTVVSALQDGTGTAHQWQVAPANQVGNPTGAWSEVGTTASLDLSWYPFEPGKCYVLQHALTNACQEVFEESQSFCVPKIFSVPPKCATDELCRRICCKEGEVFFRDRCGCGCRVVGDLVPKNP